MLTSQSDYTVYREVVAKLMSGQEELPGLPTITLDIRTALTRPELPLTTLTSLIARDPSLSALLVKYACNGLNGRETPQTLLDVVRLLGTEQVGRVTMLHSVRSLFTLHSAGHKRLFIEAWDRLILKSSTSSFLAKVFALPKVTPDHALLASLLSEIGTFAILSAFKTRSSIPTRDVYITLCREYSKSIGIIMLKKWAVDDAYVQVVRKAGDWKADAAEPFGLVDIVNLGLYHALKTKVSSNKLPPLQDLSAYGKLTRPLNKLGPTGELEWVVARHGEILAVADSLH